jgi:hypothetical protein
VAPYDRLDNPVACETWHGTHGPLECMTRPTRNHRAAELYDPFLGSGSTLIAAERLGRACFGLELDPGYVHVVVRRWETTTVLQSRQAGGVYFHVVADTWSINSDATFIASVPASLSRLISARK